VRVFTLCLMIAALPTIGAAAPLNPYLPTPGGWTLDPPVFEVPRTYEPVTTPCHELNPYWPPECRASVFVPFASFEPVAFAVQMAHEDELSGVVAFDPVAWRTFAASPASVPEPGALALVALGTVVWLGRRRV
jgi:hypothetical protein